MRTFLVLVVLSVWATSVISLEFDDDTWAVGEETVPEFFEDLNVLSEPELISSVDCPDDGQPMGKIRARQGRLCKPRSNQPPAKNPSPSVKPEPPTKPRKKKTFEPGAEFQSNPGWEDGQTEELLDFGKFKDFNAMCVLLTQGVLPYAICDSGKMADRLVSRIKLELRGTKTQVPYTLLRKCRPGMLIHYRRDIICQCNTWND